MSRFRIDVDGVVADMAQHTLDLLREEFPEDSIPSYDELTVWDIYHSDDSPLSEEQRSFAIERLDEPGFAMELPVIKGAQDALGKIREADHEILWVTTPYLGSKTWEDDRRQWLFEHFNANPKDVEFVRHKWFYQGDVFIDDKLKNVTEWSKMNDGLAVVFDSPWNQGGEGIYRLEGWEKLDSLLDKLNERKTL